MPVRNQNWYDLQEGRRYPLDDLSTGIDDAGEPIADDIIVDCHIRFPNTLGNCAYISAIHVSDNIVTAIVSAADAVDSPAVFKPIAAISLAKPIETGVNQPLTPLVPGVAGWVAFGSGIGEKFSGKYSSPIQTLITKRCARPYRPLPIPTLGKIALSTALSGIVKILGRSPVVASYEITDVEDAQVPAIVFRLASNLGDGNTLNDYGGPCKKRPESGTCDQPGLQNINGVTPDCDGNIQITAVGFSILPFNDGQGNCDGGIDIITDRGLAEACAENSVPYKRYKDLCVPESLNSDGITYWPDPLDQIPVPPDIVSSISLGDPDITGSCFPTNTCIDFSYADSTAFLTKTGLFVFEPVAPPGFCSLTPPPEAEKYSYVAADISGLNIAVLRNCGADITIGQSVTIQLQLAPGPRRNGGVILNYVPADPVNKKPVTFVAVVLDIDGGGLQIVRYNGSNFVVEATAVLLINSNNWYEIEASAQKIGNSVTISATATNIEDASNTVTLTTSTSKFGTPTNAIGLFSNRAYTYFGKLVIGG
jgi:hypothetical protein